MKDKKDLRGSIRNVVSNFPAEAAATEKIIDSISSGQEELNEEWFRKNKFKEFNGVQPSFSFDIKITDHFFKAISFTYNNDTHENQYYAFFRDGYTKEPRHKDIVVCLRSDIKTPNQVMALINALLK